MNRMLFASALAAALAAAPLFALAGSNDGVGKAGKHRHARPGMDAGGAVAERGLGRHAMRHERRSLRVLKALDLTDAQKALIADGRAAAEPIRQDLRTKIEALFQTATTPTTPTEGQNQADVRKARREKIHALIDAARTQVEPSAVKFVAALSPEQKAKLAERAQKHGKTFDEAKFTKRIAGMFLAPGHRGHRGQR